MPFPDLPHRLVLGFSVVVVLSGASGAVPVPPASPPFTPRDLGTLGGFESVAHAVGSSERVVGAAQTVRRRTREFRLHAFLWHDGQMRDLGTLGGDDSRAHDLNGRGQVVGVSQVSDPRTGEIQARAFLWEGGRMRSLGTLGGDDSRAFAISDRGHVVGSSALPPRRGHRADLRPETHAFLWNGGEMRDLGTLGGRESVARDVNVHGHAVGSSTLPNGAGPRAVLWRDGEIVDLGTLGEAESVARAVNDQGQVVGSSQLRDPRTGRISVHAFLWEEGRMRDLGTLGGRESRAYDIDEEGRVVGSSQRILPSGRTVTRAFLWENGEMTELGTLGGADSRALGISQGLDSEVFIAGESDVDPGELHAVGQHAVLWTRP